MTFRKQAKVLKAKHGYIDKLQKRREQFLFSLGRIAVSSFPLHLQVDSFLSESVIATTVLSS